MGHRLSHRSSPANLISIHGSCNDACDPRRAVQPSQHGSTIVVLDSIRITRFVQTCGIPFAAPGYLIREHVDEPLDSIDLGVPWSILFYLFPDKLVNLTVCNSLEPPSNQNQELFGLCSH